MTNLEKLKEKLIRLRLKTMAQHLDPVMRPGSREKPQPHRHPSAPHRFRTGGPSPERYHPPLSPVPTAR